MPFNPDLSLHAIVVNLIATEDGRVPATQGALAHAAFLDLVRAADPDLATRLHGRDTRQPFTLSPLRGLPGHAEDGHYRLRAGQRVWLRLTLLDPALFMAFMRRLLAGPDLWATTEGRLYGLRIGDIPFTIESAIGVPGGHPWVGYTSAGALRANARTDSRIRMLFASPTAISLGEKGPAKQRMVIIPWPQCVFASLRGVWNRLTGDDIPIEFESWVADYVMVREVRNWRTGVYQLKRGVRPGGAGDVVFEALDDTPDHLRTLNLLADFAFYSGVGAKTTMGMGQARRL